MSSLNSRVCLQFHTCSLFFFDQDMLILSEGSFATSLTHLFWSTLMFPTPQEDWSSITRTNSFNWINFFFFQYGHQNGLGQGTSGVCLSTDKACRLVRRFECVQISSRLIIIIIFFENKRLPTFGLILRTPKDPWKSLQDLLTRKEATSVNSWRVASLMPTATSTPTEEKLTFIHFFFW